MQCLYCGKESWLPSGLSRDPDFCSLAHREKYNNRFNLAMRRIGGDAPAAAPDVERPRHFGPVVGIQPAKPAMGIRPVFDQPPESANEPVEPPEFTGIFTTAEPTSGIRRAVGRHAIGAAVVSVIAGLAIWFGGDSKKPAADPVKSAARTLASAAPARPDVERPAPISSATSPATRSAPSGWQHPVAWVQSAAAKRAETQVAESFDRGMAAWGAAPHAWMPGWSRSADGYVRPGELALFQPTLRYTDYRMDFFGQIENKSMSWVVRGKDELNYYAVKVAVIEPGLRPVLAMTHFPVVHGRPGRKIQVPLSVMAHNGVPYHVSVEVKGNTYTASIEGQQVDSWFDDSFASGGVGFFSEAGARARIYWMKVSRNDDWFGWLCGRIASTGQPREVAWLGRPAFFGLPEYAAQRP